MATAKVKRLIKCTSEPQKCLLCPLCNDVFDRPVISTSCGHTFCTSCAQLSQHDKKPCPIDNSSLDTGHLVPNKALCSQIDEIEVYCPNGLSLSRHRPEDRSSDLPQDDRSQVEVTPGGCPEKMKYFELEQHLLVCLFASVECPQGGSLCGQLRRREVEVHLLECPHYHCTNKSYGEGFRLRITAGVGCAYILYIRSCIGMQSTEH